VVEENEPEALDNSGLCGCQNCSGNIKYIVETRLLKLTVIFGVSCEQTEKLHLSSVLPLILPFEPEHPTFLLITPVEKSRSEPKLSGCTKHG